jgi:hypothetical protein
MPTASTRPNIFISYAHSDEPEKPAEGEVQWLSFVRRYLHPAVKDGIFDLWVDRQMMGGADWDPEIEQKLRACDVFILLVSANSMASEYIVGKEIAIIRERQAKGDDVYFYPLLLTPTPDAGLNKVKDKNIRPRDAKPFSSFSYHERLQHMTDAANEIAKIAQQIVGRRGGQEPSTPPVRPGYVHIAGLPETAYERLVGREMEMQHLDNAWANRKINIVSLIAEGGAGKSALVNEWLKKLQTDHYRGAEAVLGWSFYSQGSKERATSAEQFFDWALDKLSIKTGATNASAKGDAIAEAMGRSRVLLVLDGVEPLQYGLDSQQGELKDAGLRALLRRFATLPPTTGHGLVVLTSGVAVKNIAHWRDGAAPVLELEQLSEEAGARLLRDNGVWGTDAELKLTTRTFGGHPLALDLLASFLKETQFGDVRQRDHIRAYFADGENPRYDHARRVMESYEKEWLAGKPVQQAIMHIVGLFDRPASGDCVQALRMKPAIEGLTDAIIDLDEGEWRRAVTRLRDVRLLTPRDPSAPDGLDAHPLVREWFGEQLERRNSSAWQAANRRLYNHLRDTTREGKTPTLADLMPLYQAIAHGCRAGRHQEALDHIYVNRILRRQNGRIEFYSLLKLGAFGSNLAAISWFFDKPYGTPVATLKATDQVWVVAEAARHLSAVGRLLEALPGLREAARIFEADENWALAAIAASNLSEAELRLGDISAALDAAQRSAVLADRSGKEELIFLHRVRLAAALHAANRRDKASLLFAYAERKQKTLNPQQPLLYARQGYQFCDLLVDNGDYVIARDRATRTIDMARQQNWVVDIGMDAVTIGRAHLGLALSGMQAESNERRKDALTTRTRLNEAIDLLRASGEVECVARGLLARAAFRRSVGDWGNAERDLDEVEEITELGPMKLYQCDARLERARIAFARIATFAPLNRLIEDGPLEPIASGADDVRRLKAEAHDSLATATELISSCGYHRRDDELAELQLVSDVPPLRMS